LLKFDFDNQTALVTGGTRGIGAAIARQLQELGARVILTGTKSAAPAGSADRYLQADFTDPESVRRFLDALEETERIDVCINNAGVNIVKPFVDASFSDYSYIQDVNITAPTRILGIVGRKMIRHGYGRVVNIASIWSLITRQDRSLYSSSKHALIGLTKTLAVEWAQHHILVNAVSPGFTMTEMTKATNTDSDIENITRTIPIRRFAETDEIARVVIFLASRLNTYMTGQNIAVDGGYSIV
jgi:3-oxoacyl-[acyl-carrier protein] reductase